MRKSTINIYCHGVMPIQQSRHTKHMRIMSFQYGVCTEDPHSIVKIGKIARFFSAVYYSGSFISA